MQPSTSVPAVPVLNWHGCYDDQWGDLIVPEAFKHPAKFAKGLIERIYDYGFEQGYWRKGDLIGDPFGGEAVTRKERKSFFRRLYESKLPPDSDCRLDWEEVIFVRKPIGVNQ